MNLLQVPVTEVLDHMAAKSAQLQFCIAVVVVSVNTNVLAILKFFKWQGFQFM
jgi:hypothetical protein